MVNQAPEATAEKKTSTLEAVLEKKSAKIAYTIEETEKLPNSRFRYKLKIEEAEMAPRIEEALKDFVKAVQVPGFRPGKAPIHLVRNRFDGPAREETVKRMVGRLAELVAEEKKVEPLAQPMLLEYKSLKGSPTTIEIVLEVRPEVALTEESVTGIAVEATRFVVDDAAVDQAIERLRTGQAEFVAQGDDATLELTDGVLVDCFVFDAQGAPIADRCARGHYSTRIREEFPEQVAAEMIGKKKGDRIQLTFEETSEPHGPDGHTHTERVSYDLSILEVKKRVLPALDDAFASDIDPKLKTVAELRDKTRRDLNENEENRHRGEVLAKIFEEVAKRVPFDLPGTLVYRNAENTVQSTEQRLKQYGLSLNNLDQNMREGYFRKVQSDAAVGVRNFLIADQASRVFNITPSAEQIEAELGKIAERTNRKPMAIRASLEAKKQFDQFVSDLRLKLTNDFLISRANVTVVEKAANTPGAPGTETKTMDFDIAGPESGSQTNG